MPLSSVGTAVTPQQVKFNTGVVTFGSKYLIDVQDIAINMSFTEKLLQAIGSNKSRSIMRTDFKCGASFTVDDHETPLLATFMASSSTDAGGNLYSVLDGQQAALTFTITVYPNNNQSNAVQYQFTNALLTNVSQSQSLQAYGQSKCTIVATDVNVFEATGAATT